MKNFLIVFLVLFSACFPGCEKIYFTNEPVVTTQTINVNLNLNQSYTDTLPLFDSGSVSYIHDAATNAMVSTIVTDTNGVSYYQYTPAKDFTGTDAVMINSSGYQNNVSPTNSSSSKNGKPNNSPIQNIVLTYINFTIKGK
jgi:hypothetical protein